MQAPFIKTNLLSLCVIVRDEAHNLGRLMLSTQPWVDEVVVVDTGSTDGTVAVAKSWGARVLESPWQNSFALARNHSLDEATRPWALVLDADEQLIVSDPALLSKMLHSAHQAFAVDCHDLRDDGSFAVAPLLRLFRRDVPAMRFEGAVHEQVEGVARGQVGVVRATFMHFVHDGHTAQVMGTRLKDERNLALADAQVRERPADPFAWFCWGQALLTRPSPKRREQASQAFAASLLRLEARHEGEAFVVSLFASQATTLVELGKTAEAAAFLDAALEAFPQSPDLRLARARHWLEQKQAAKAEVDLRVCLSGEAAAFFVRLDPNATGHEAHVLLGLALIHLGRVAEAETQLRTAITLPPAKDGRAKALLATIEARGSAR